jgi:O-antigen biosynthesis alpha-1,2-rahmnosyltransferase
LNKEKEPFISICIPSYNRPDEIYRLLKSIDASSRNEIEIIVCEDMSPRRPEISAKVMEYSNHSDYNVKYYENEKNLGYDKNLRELIQKASGEYIILMGDDDWFVPEALDKFIGFLKGHRELGYILKTHLLIHENGTQELFKYYPESIFFEKGEYAYLSLFRKSVFISGFTFKREYSLDYLVDYFDGTLLFQLYILAEITLKYSSAFCDISLTAQDKSGTPFFGSSESESSLYTPNTITVDNSINFMKGFFKITEYIDQQYGLNSTQYIRKEFSKYSYPVLSIQRKKGLMAFWSYATILNQEIRINNSPYYYIYLIGLIVLGEHICDKVIRLIKRKVGRTPDL